MVVFWMYMFGAVLLVFGTYQRARPSLLFTLAAALILAVFLTAALP